MLHKMKKPRRFGESTGANWGIRKDHQLRESQLHELSGGAMMLL